MRGREVIRAARVTADLTYAQASNVIYVHIQTWTNWKRGERDLRPAFWELNPLKTRPPSDSRALLRVHDILSIGRAK